MHDKALFLDLTFGMWSVKYLILLILNDVLKQTEDDRVIFLIRINNTEVLHYEHNHLIFFFSRTLLEFIQETLEKNAVESRDSSARRQHGQIPREISEGGDPSWEETWTRSDEVHDEIPRFGEGHRQPNKLLSSG